MKKTYVYWETGLEKEFPPTGKHACLRCKKRFQFSRPVPIQPDPLLCRRCEPFVLGVASISKDFARAKKARRIADRRVRAMKRLVAMSISREQHVARIVEKVQLGERLLHGDRLILELIRRGDQPWDEEGSDELDDILGEDDDDGFVREALSEGKDRGLDNANRVSLEKGL